jgi:NAD(P)-dependent dehydrogenase (short-subunit alcohol dehydrogenase family)
MAQTQQSGRRFVGKVVMITGGSRGIGNAVATLFAQEGADVAITDVVQAELESAVQRLKTFGGKAQGYFFDVSRSEQVRNGVTSIIRDFGRIDVLVNNAGIFLDKATFDVSEEEWDRTIDVHLKGTFLCSQRVGQTMAERRQGTIVNMSSVQGFASFPGRAAYDAAKAGIIALTKTLAVEWADYGIRVNAVAPGYIQTENLKEKIRSKTRDASMMIRRTPMKRLGEPKEIASAIAFLASDDASYITGETLLVDGGWLAYGYI